MRNNYMLLSKLHLILIAMSVPVTSFWTID